MVYNYSMDSQLKEMAFMYYQATLNIDLAMDKLDFNEEQRKELLDDDFFMRRLAIQDATEFDDRIKAIRNIADDSNVNEGIRLKANIELLKLQFGDSIYRKDEVDDRKRPSKIVLIGAYPE